MGRIGGPEREVGRAREPRDGEDGEGGGGQRARGGRFRTREGEAESEGYGRGEREGAGVGGRWRRAVIRAGPAGSCQMSCHPGPGRLAARNWRGALHRRRTTGWTERRWSRDGARRTRAGCGSRGPAFGTCCGGAAASARARGSAGRRSCWPPCRRVGPLHPPAPSSKTARLFIESPAPQPLHSHTSFSLSLGRLFLVSVISVALLLSGTVRPSIRHSTALPLAPYITHSSPPPTRFHCRPPARLGPA